MWVGLNIGGFATYQQEEVEAAVNTVRGEGYELPEEYGDQEWSWGTRGKTVNIIFNRAGADEFGQYSYCGPEQETEGLPAQCEHSYEGHRWGVQALNPTTWAEEAVAFVEKYPKINALEVLNEAYGEWYWGPGAYSQTNATAYATLLKTVWEKLEAYKVKHGSRPLILASDTWEGADKAWNEEVFTKSGIDALEYVNGIVAHPYGGIENRAKSAQGDRAEVEELYRLDKKPIWVTEVGWPTACGSYKTSEKDTSTCPKGTDTSNSEQWTETEQAANIYNFIKWARGTGYVADVDVFQYNDYSWGGIKEWWGIDNEALEPKLSYFALKEIAKEEACTVCT